MPAAIAIPAIISAGAAIYGAVEQKHAADKATQAETQAGQQALAVQQNEYNQTRADLAPYTGAGVSSLQQLGSIFGVTVPAAQSGTVTPAVGTPGTFQRTLGGPPLPGTYAGQAMPRPGTSPTPPTDPGVGTLASLGGGSVPIQAPNGNIYQVPATRVSEALQQGGKRVG